MKTIIGLVEKVKIIGKKSAIVEAKFDTGANTTSIDYRLAAKLQLGPIIGVSCVKSAISKRRKLRPVVKVVFEIHGKYYPTKAALEDRSHMKYKVLIGRKLINSNFIIDVEKNGA